MSPLGSRTRPAHNECVLLTQQEATRVADSLTQLSEGLSGDVKKLTNFTPEFRLRVGTYRVLFEVEEGDRVIVYRVLHRREA